MTKPQQQQTPYINDLPKRELEKIRDTLPEVTVKIRRKSAQGPFVILPQVSKSPQELLSGSFDMEMMRELGGGEYEFQCFDPMTNEEVTPRWRCRYPGAPNMNALKSPEMLGYAHPGHAGASGPGGTPVAGFGAPTPFGGFVPPMSPIPGVTIPPQAYVTPGVAIPQMLPGGQVSAPPPTGLPAGAHALPVPQQWHIYYTGLRRSGQLPDGASMHSDAIASTWAERFDSRQQNESAENKMLREKLAELQASLASSQANAAVQALGARIEALQMAQMRGNGGDSAMQLELMKLQMAAQAQQAQQNQQMMMMLMEQRKGPDIGSLLTGLAALAGPLITSYFSTQSNKASSETQVHLRQMELSQQSNQTLVQTLLASGDKKSGMVELLGVLAPIVGPLLLTWMEGRSPEALMAVQQQSVQGQMMMTKMVTEFIDQMTKDNGGEQPWWAPVLMGAVEGAQDVIPLIMDFVQQKKGGSPALPAGARAQQAPPGGRAVPQQAPAQGQQSQQPQQPAEGYDMPWEALHARNPAVASEVQRILGVLPKHLGFHTPEWAILLFNFSQQVEPREMADMLLTHLENCQNLSMLPTVLAEIDSNPEIIRPFLMRLPVANRAPDYAKAVVDLVVDAIQNADGGEEHQVPPTPPVITPAPALATTPVSAHQVPKEGAA